MGYSCADMRERFAPTPDQITNANLGAVPADSRVGRFMIAARNSDSPTTLYHHIFTTVRRNVTDTTRSIADRAKTIARDAGPAALVVGGSIGISLLLAGCGPDVSGAGHTPTDGGTGHTPDNFGGQVADCVNANTPPVHPGDAPAPGIDPTIFDACKDAVMNGTAPTIPQH